MTPYDLLILLCLYTADKSGDFDLTVNGAVDEFVACETKLVVQELTMMTMCLNYRCAPNFNNGLVIMMVDER